MHETPSEREAVTRLITQAANGERGASEDLLPIVYAELRQLAQARLAREGVVTLMQPTALVHEAYLRLLGTSDIQWNGHGHFFGAAAEAMRRILIERARQRLSLKRGEGRVPLPIKDDLLPSYDESADLVALHEALEGFEQTHPDKAELVKLRHFAGLSEAQAADALGIARATAARHWAFARAWLYDAMRQEDDERTHPVHRTESEKVSMTPPEGTIIETLFERARHLAADDRDAFLTEACDDVAVRDRIEALIRAAETVDDFLDRPAMAQSSATMEPATPGMQIGRYRIMESIGEGGFGSVYRAVQTEPVQRDVALKIIKLGMDTREIITRFKAERQALALMAHHNIARVFDAGATDRGRPYFVMELVDGHSITRYCEHERVDLDQRIDLFIQVCAAVEHAHQKGIIHRDLKPSNVLVTTEDGAPVPKVIDFGIAKAMDRDLADDTLWTGDHPIIGTPAYMSPEQSGLGDGIVDTRSDIYALGVLLYELLTGVTPFDNRKLLESGPEVMRRIIWEETPERPSTRRLASPMPAADHEALSTDLDWIVMKCLEKDRDRRYDTASALRDDVERFRNGEAVVAAPPEFGYRLRKFVRRNRRSVMALSALGLTLIVGAVGTTGGLIWALQQKARAESAEQATQRELVRVREVKSIVTGMLSNVRPEEVDRAEMRVLERILDDTAARLARDEIVDELIAAELHLVIGNAFLELSLLDDANHHLLKAQALYEQNVDRTHADLLEARHTIAVLRRVQGRFDEAEPMIRDVLAMRRTTLGEEHPQTLRTKGQFGVLRLRQGRYDDAETLLFETLRASERVSGAESGEAMFAMNHLSEVYKRLGRYEDAERLSRRTVDICRRRDGDEHPATLSAVTNLALILYDVARYDDARGLHEEVLASSERVFGPEHISTLMAMNNVAMVHWNQGHYDDAAPLYERIIEIGNRTLGEEHPTPVTGLHNLGLVRADQRDFVEAERLMKQALQIRRATNGESHPSTLGVKNSLGVLYARQGRLADAEPLIAQVLDARTRALGPEHPKTMTSRNGLANLHLRLGLNEKAAREYQTIVEISSRDIGEDHPHTLRSMNNLGVAHKRLGHYQKAEALYDKVFRTRELKLGPDHPETLSAMINLGELYGLTKRPEDARTIFEAMIEKARVVVGVDHPWTQEAIKGLATALEQLGEPELAREVRAELTPPEA